MCTTHIKRVEKNYINECTLIICDKKVTEFVQELNEKALLISFRPSQRNSSSLHQTQDPYENLENSNVFVPIDMTHSFTIEEAAEAPVSVTNQPSDDPIP